MQLRTLILTVGLFLGACTSVMVQEIPGPDGRMDKLVKCYAIEDCYTKAAELCNGAYKILNTTAQFHGNYSSFQMIDSTTDLLIACEDPKPSAPEQKPAPQAPTPTKNAAPDTSAKPLLPPPAISPSKPPHPKPAHSTSDAL